MDAFIGAATVVVTVAGLWLAYNYNRQMALKLSETRLEAYSRLWVITGIAAPTRLDGWGDEGILRPDERRNLWAAMTDWYYAKGGGMLLTRDTKEVYLNVKHNLVCVSSELRPACLAEVADRIIKEELRNPGDPKLEDEDKVRGILAIKLISLLRTQLKGDLAIYGPTYSGPLEEYECCFLTYSGVDLRSKAWAEMAGFDTRWWRLPRLVAFAHNLWKGKRKAPPKQDKPPLLKVERMAKTPPSSRMAMKNALRADSAGPAEAASEILKGLMDRSI
jgi:hypothetical protein